MKKRKPFVSIIVVNYNGKDLLYDCFKSLFKIDYPKSRFEVIMVDNCSEDDSVDFVKNKFSKVKIIKNDVNNYCKANNLGIKASKDEYVVLLNNDVKVKKEWLSGLVKEIQRDKKIAAVCSKVLDYRGNVQNVGLVPLPNFYWDERGSGKSSGDYSKVQEVPVVSNISVIYRKKYFKKIGFFDEDFNIYCEDVDMSLRIKNAGWKIMFAPDSVLYHKFHGTATKQLSEFFIERNRLLFIAKHYPDKLSTALIGSGYFTSKDSLDKLGGLFNIMPDVFYKLFKHHNEHVVKDIARDILIELEKVVNYENKMLNEKLLEGHKGLVETKKDLKNKILETRRIKKIIRWKDKKIKEYKDNLTDKNEKLKIQKDLQEANKLYKQEISKISEDLKTRLDEVLFKDGLILEKEEVIKKKEDILKSKEEKIKEVLSEKEDIIREKENETENKDKIVKELSSKIKYYKNESFKLSNQLRNKLDEILVKDGDLFERDKKIEKLTDELNGIYNSHGYRFILRPLWTVIFNARIFFKFILRKIKYFVVFLVSFTLVPFYVFLSLIFLIENLLWEFFGFFMKLTKKKRVVVPFQDLNISLVIPNWNGLEYLNKCLSSIFKIEDFKNGRNEVLVVDDGSSDGSVKYVKDHFPQVKIIRNRKNRKFGYTCNRGVKEACGELIVLINNDVIVTKNFLDPIIKHFKDDEVFSVSPKSYGWDRKTFNFGMHMGKFENGYVRFWNECETKNDKEIYKTAPSLIAIGGAMVFRKRDFLWLGGFDSIYRPNSWEDIDISYRAWKRGLKVLYEPESVVYHKDAATVTYERHKEIKNELLFTWKNITDKNILREHLSLFPWIGSLRKISLVKGILWAIRYLPSGIFHRFKERRYFVCSDKEILDGCMKYYRNFERRGLKHFSAKDKRTVLLITPFMPYPLNVGGKVRIHNLSKFLSEKYDIILLTLINKKSEKQFIPELKKIYKEVYAIYAKSPLNLLFPSRYRFAYSEELKHHLIRIQKKYPIDLVHIESNELLYLTDFVKHIPVIYTEHDISLMFFKNSYYKKRKILFFKEFYDYLKRIRFHKHYYKKIDKVVSLSKKDIEIINGFFRGKSISYIPTGTDIDYFSFVQKREKLKNILYVGHYSHYPNEEAVNYFAKKIFPAVKKRFPSANFYIVGSAPTEEVKKLSSLSGIQVIGEVDEVKSYFDKSDIFVNPTRISAGIKGKVLEAFACGVPVVSTTKGIWGLEAEPDKEILIADTPSQFFNQIEKLFTDSKLYSDIARQARGLVEEKYNWEKISGELDKVYENMILKSELNYLDKKKRKKRKLYSLSEKFLPDSELKSHSFIIDRIKKYVEEIIEDRVLKGPEMGPEELHLELTYRCQSKCIMCDVWDYGNRVKVQEDELDKNQIKDFIEKSSYLKGVKSIVISGGEPFLREDLEDICGYVISNFPSACINILTNMIDTERILKQLRVIMRKYKPSQLWLSTSIDGIGNVHDRIRNYKGAFSKAIATLDKCKKEFPSIKLASTFTITPYNTNELLKVRELCRNKDIDFFAQFSVPKEACEQFKWTKEHFCQVQSGVEKIIKELIKGKNYNDIKDDPGLMAQLYYWGYFVEYKQSPDRFFKKCVAGSRFAICSPYGDIYFCPVLKNKVIGNIRKKKFDKVWMSNRADEVRSYIEKSECHCWLLCIIFPLLKQILEKNKPMSNIPGSNKKFVKRKIDTIKSENNPDKLQERNKVLNERELDSGKYVLKSFPQEIGIGTHFKCNAKCKFCQGGDYPEFSLDIYKNFFEKRLNYVFPYVKRINFCGYGEILLSPNIKSFLRHLNETLPVKRKIITTNGIPLNNGIISFMRNNNYSLQVSLHASSSALHEDITSTCSFNKIIKNIEKIVDLKSRDNGLKVYIKSTLTTLNIEDLPNLVKLSARLGVDGVDCNYMVIYKNAHFKLSCFFQQELTNESFNRAQKYADDLDIDLNLPPFFNQETYDQRVCSEPWEYFYVETQGSTTACCHAPTHIGYLNRDKFGNIWNSVEYQNLRKRLFNNVKCQPCYYCYNNNNKNVNNIESHISFRPEIQQLIKI